MPLSDTIDSAINDYLIAYDRAQDEFISDVKDMEDEGLSTEEIILAISAVSIADYWLADLGMQAAMDNLMLSFDEILDSAVFFGKITEAELLAMRSMQQSSILQFTGTLGEDLRMGILRGQVFRNPADEIKAMISRAPNLRPQYLETYINTAMSTYARTVTAVQALDVPANTKFIYIGPLDEKTRPICVKMLGEGGLTRKQIESRYPGAFLDGGGFNCRHKWEKMSSKVQNREMRNAAKQRFTKMTKAEKGRAITLQEYYG